MDFLGFYDAAAPVIEADSIDMSIAYRKGRYDQSADYLNLPFDKEQYDAWFEALQQARQHTPHDWEKVGVFRGLYAHRRNRPARLRHARFGPMKPVGLEHPDTGKTLFPPSRNCAKRTCAARCTRSSVFRPA